MMKRKLMSIVILTLIVSSMCLAVVIASQNEASAIIDRLISIKVINTDVLNLMDTQRDYEYNASDFITRGELSAIIYGFLGFDGPVDKVPDDVIFSDVPSTHWAHKYIRVATNHGAFSSVEEKLFYPDKNATYTEVMKAVLDVCGYAPLAKTCGKGEFGYLSLSNILKLTDGMSKFKPADNITKGDLAIFLNNSLDLYYIVADGNYEDGSPYCYVMDGTSYFKDGERRFYEEETEVPVTILKKINIGPRRLVDPFASGVYGNDPNYQSMLVKVKIVDKDISNGTVSFTNLNHPEDKTIYVVDKDTGLDEGSLEIDALEDDMDVNIWFPVNSTGTVKVVDILIPKNQPVTIYGP